MQRLTLLLSGALFVVCQSYCTHRAYPVFCATLQSTSQSTSQSTLESTLESTSAQADATNSDAELWNVRSIEDEIVRLTKDIDHAEKDKKLTKNEAFEFKHEEEKLIDKADNLRDHRCVGCVWCWGERVKDKLEQLDAKVLARMTASQQLSAQKITPAD